MNRNPVPQAVRSQVHVHNMVMPPGVTVSHDQGQANIAAQQEQAAFWEGLREVLREEMNELLDERERRD